MNLVRCVYTGYINCDPRDPPVRISLSLNQRRFGFRRLQTVGPTDTSPLRNGMSCVSSESFDRPSVFHHSGSYIQA